MPILALDALISTTNPTVHDRTGETPTRHQRQPRSATAAVVSGNAGQTGRVAEGTCVSGGGIVAR